MGFGIFVFVIWIGFWVGFPAVKFIRTQNSLRKQWKRVDARIIDKIYSEKMTGIGLKSPLVEFEINGNAHQSISEYFNGNVLSLLPTWKNMSIKILVDPQNNNRWIIDAKYVRFIFLIWFLMYSALIIYGITLYELSL
ncbi:MAG: hypothetical protein ACJAUD_000212 [Crocinitomicaceae bacterium]|jgi:hypothetical protein